MARKSPDERFWSRIRKQPGDGCWEWTGGCCSYGYGSIKVKHKVYGTHRLSWELHVGKIPNGIWVLHHCDNPKCVRPSHLFLGTRTDNVRDMEAKGRRTPARGAKHGRYNNPHKTGRGEQNGRAKLSDRQVVIIRKRVADGETVALLSRELKVSEGALRHIVKRRHWRHI